MQLAKLHGLGNDFLVLVDMDDVTPIDAGLAIALCDRRRGLGADGLIRVSPGTDGADVTMTLRNADGSLAEMSGNGIRCLALAVARTRGVASLDLRVATGGGVRAALAAGRAGRLRRGRRRHGQGEAGARAGHRLAVAAGRRRPAPWPRRRVPRPAHAGRRQPPPRRARHRPPRRRPRGRRTRGERQFAAGINVGFVATAAGEVDALDLRVWERGAGITEACGSGATAAAHAAHEWGLVGERVTVHLPGGDVRVAIGDTLRLSGPAVHVADCTIDDDTLAWR
jgi:diaminopimelate epimerase